MLMTQKPIRRRMENMRHGRSRSDAERIDELERKVCELQTELLELRRLIGRPIPDPVIRRGGGI